VPQQEVESAVLITVTLIGHDDVRSTVTMSEDTSVRAATSKYDLFWRTLKENGSTVPLTTRAVDGDIVTIEDDRVDES